MPRKGSARLPQVFVRIRIHEDYSGMMETLRVQKIAAILAAARRSNSLPPRESAVEHIAC